MSRNVRFLVAAAQNEGDLPPRCGQSALFWAFVPEMQVKWQISGADRIVFGHGAFKNGHIAMFLGAFQLQKGKSSSFGQQSFSVRAKRAVLGSKCFIL